mmetsp:Transcript_351/g.1356  ORF Transcript_351/g.1356 Transcript_351/m.1356 type:complete len:348 (-) Transcript_351:157-1200(-)
MGVGEARRARRRARRPRSRRHGLPGGLRPRGPLPQSAPRRRRDARHGLLPHPIVPPLRHAAAHHAGAGRLAPDQGALGRVVRAPRRGPRAALRGANRRQPDAAHLERPRRARRCDGGGQRAPRRSRVARCRQGRATRRRRGGLRRRLRVGARRLRGLVPARLALLARSLRRPRLGRARGPRELPRIRENDRAPRRQRAERVQDAARAVLRPAHRRDRRGRLPAPALPRGLRAGKLPRRHGLRLHDPRGRDLRRRLRHRRLPRAPARPALDPTRHAADPRRRPPPSPRRRGGLRPAVVVASPRVVWERRLPTQQPTCGRVFLFEETCRTACVPETPASMCVCFRCCFV